MFNVKLTRLKSSHNIIRTDETIGTTYYLPEIGKGFTLIAEPIDEHANIRYITTSKVIEIEESVSNKNTIRFNTLNSSYRLDII